MNNNQIIFDIPTMLLKKTYVLGNQNHMACLEKKN